ncbi:heme biosynthesis HemY N-terminal domain-containing protein [Shewanella cyperi]|uniref:heme biosynthesis HemY N-terminal domain-containing protein n=1 Tax=Shewanella cyperi TaxID=2814292 RepID=UPI001A953945|nr:heme biosynthesis HemY N-terminal domain-containing protein [Shewanella cyperi]QSX40550.1 heme biosynthesis protein HemY [Shewanella cyperi]
MIRSLFYLLIVLMGLCLSPYLIGNTGYVYIAAWDYQIETSVVFASLLLILFYAVLYLAESAFIKGLSLLLGSRYLPQKWRNKAAKKHTLQGALALAEEDWPQAEKAMLKGAANGELPALNLLAAARAAHQQGKPETRDTLLDQVDPQHGDSVKLAKARYLLQQGELAQARILLDKFNPSSRSKPAIIRLAKELYLAQQDWQALKLLLPAITKQKLLDEQQLTQLSNRINLSLLTDAVAHSEQELDKCWHWLSRQERSSSELMSQYALGLHAFGRHEDAIKWLSKALKKDHPEPAFVVLPKIVTVDDTEVIKLLQQLSSGWADDSDYLQSLAKVQLLLRENKAARDTLEKLCQLHPTREHWSAFAHAQEQLGDTHGAFLSYKKAATCID